VFPRDTAAVGALVGAYLHQTEAEKAERELTADAFPERYAREIDDPASAFAGRRIYVAAIEGQDVGLVVSTSTPPGTELSRFWTDPRARGRGVGSALLTAALGAATRPVRLSVWEWREPALRMYHAAGFEIVPSWDDRPGLVCLELRSATPPAHR
jgi:GNAT superfamily N-acetyltransferase